MEAPDLPVDLVCWPLTFRFHQCLRPLCILTFFIRSMSSLNFVSRSLEVTCSNFPSLMSFLLLRNHCGNPWLSGLAMTSVTFETSSSVSSPALRNCEATAWWDLFWPSCRG